uniref:Uncharacterized protein n=1 Tax=Oryza rufipogon TaxID=4529 RepID=A0A0E0R5G3_ORYRU
MPPSIWRYSTALSAVNPSMWSRAFHLFVLPWQAPGQEQVPPLRHGHCVQPLLRRGVNPEVHPGALPQRQLRPRRQDSLPRQRQARGRGRVTAPCFCPEPRCGFAGATSSLLTHFTGGHGWPPATEFRRARTFDLQVQEGKRVLRYHILIFVSGFINYLINYY